MMSLDLQASIRLSSWVLLACAALTGCDEAKPDVSDPKPDSGLERDADAVSEPEPQPCEGAADGESCGDDKHCIKQRCLFNICGDGVVAGTEACDDGNELVGDECSPSCVATPATCGDARVDAGEECDDGNLIATDACSTSCTRNVCGNARVDPGEECDDGNQVDVDICSNRCLRQLCRNGVLDPGEECDDGNTNPNDGCNNACEQIACGDGKPEQQEECDDGNRVDTDGCSNACTGNVCGNGRVDPNELCDGALTKTGAVPAGSRCDACTEIKEDRCRECEIVECREQYQEIGFDWYKFCYEEPAPGSTIPQFNKKCTELMNCVKSSRCDMKDPVKPFITCYCGEGTLDECGMGVKITGACIKEFEAATDANPGDYTHVLNLTSSTASPSGLAAFLSDCHRERCAAQCRN